MLNLPNPDKKRRPRDPRGDLGKWAEKLSTAWLEKWSTSSSMHAFHRYPDARTARGAFPRQPADFLVTKMVPAMLPTGELSIGRVTHLEVKETTLDTRLPKDKLGQYGKLYMFFLAGIDVRVLVYRSKKEDWVYLTGKDLFSQEEVPTSFNLKGCKSFATHAEALQEIFG